MFISGLGTATPSRCYRQRDCWEALRSAAQFSQLEPRSQAILRKVLLGDNGIISRHLALEPLSEAFDLTPDALHARFLKHAPELASRAAAEALTDAATAPEAIDAV